MAESCFFSLRSPACEETTEKAPSGNWEVCSHHTLHLPTPWHWTSLSPQLWEINFCYLSQFVYNIDSRPNWLRGWPRSSKAQWELFYPLRSLSVLVFFFVFLSSTGIRADMLKQKSESKLSLLYDISKSEKQMKYINLGGSWVLSKITIFLCDFVFLALTPIICWASRYVGAEQNAL